MAQLHSCSSQSSPGAHGAQGTAHRAATMSRACAAVPILEQMEHRAQHIQSSYYLRAHLAQQVEQFLSSKWSTAQATAAIPEHTEQLGLSLYQLGLVTTD